MDKRREENLRVKENIINTLFRFMQKKSLSDITVTELVKGAGVARASFYRNYDSKEDVLELFRSEMKEDPTGLYSYDNVVLSFSYFRKYRKYILDLYHSGFAMAILEEINRFHESIEGTMPSSSIEKYKLYMYTGALFNTAIVWLSEENPADAADIASFFFQKIKNIEQ